MDSNEDTSAWPGGLPGSHPGARPRERVCLPLRMSLVPLSAYPLGGATGIWCSGDHVAEKDDALVI